MAQVGVAAGAGNLGARAKQAFVHKGRDVFRGNRLPEAGPTGAGFVFVLRAVKVISAADTLVNPWFVVVPSCSGEGALCSLFAGDMVLFQRQQSAPLGIRLDNLVGNYIFPLGYGIQSNLAGRYLPVTQGCDARVRDRRLPAAGGNDAE